MYDATRGFNFGISCCRRKDSMAYIKEYWTDKEKRAEQAKKHTKKMEADWGEVIKESIEDTICYSPNHQFDRQVKNETNIFTIILDDCDSVSAVLKYHAENKMAVLNFSSYKNPGGMFINGSKAQEECLCHESFLYNVLSKHNDFYEWNNSHKNKALYLDRALYSPNILFSRTNKDKDETIRRFCDVITCAAPNKSAAQKYQNVSNEENTRVLDSRIKFILDIAKENDVDTLILGAYGCGVFGQDPTEVANIFKHYLDTEFNACFKTIVFAIPNGRAGNLEAFKKVFMK